MNLVINIAKCNVCLSFFILFYFIYFFFFFIYLFIFFFFIKIEKLCGNWPPDGPNSVRFHFTVWDDMACMLFSKSGVFRSR